MNAIEAFALRPEGAGEDTGHRLKGRAIARTWRDFLHSPRNNLSADRDRWILWLPVCLGAGIGLYFLLPVEPPLWVGLLTAGVLLALVAAAWRRVPGAVVLLLGLLAAALGLAAAQVRTEMVAAPVLAQDLGPVTVVGVVEGVEDKAGALRVTLAPVSVERLSPARLPHSLRVTVRTGGARPEAGQTVRLDAVLMPPPAPSAPGAFNFPRMAWFDRLGAVGYAVSTPDILSQPPRGAVADAVEHMRSAVTARVREVIPGAEGQIAAALLTGARAGIPEPTLEAFRDSGLAHLLSISGLHMTLVAGLIFVGVRGVLAAVPAIALRHDVKKWTAAIALLAAAFYLLLSGAAIPSQRAFVMAAIVLLAVIVDRTAISLRTLGWAALFVLLTQPESLVGPSFQMSFAAVTALVAGYELVAPKLSAWRGRGRGRWTRAPALYMLGITASTVIASLATAPFAAYHFNAVPLYSLFANLAVMPLVSLIVMPMAIAGLLLMPLGLDWLPFTLMGWGLDGVTIVAETVASWPGSVLYVPPMPIGGLAAVALGGLWLCLWRRPWRLLGLAVAVVGASSAWWSAGPDILINDEATLIAVRGPTGGLILSPGRSDGFARDLWRERHGAEEAVSWPHAGGSTGAWPLTLDSPARLACDSVGCVYEARGLKTALVQHPAAVPEDCYAADVIVATVPVRRPCDHTLAVVDYWDLWKKGAHAVWLDGTAVRVDTVAETMGNRPWSPFTRYWEERS
ncbi:competence protein [Caenispirillum salinarum AK4]|uniref:Competence protein n=1 Tax=Caenispirillum salinarum AK4 TaxID=1238182 RepID=K9GZT9_9PROT|nr:ComEC/Rec2 family competence protein [Caenispirillum salinarum]EKV30807.1 competence protein [Caenispirillum salinarum AK4]